MRIFYAADMPNTTLLDSSLWHNNLFLSLVNLGYELVPFEYNLAFHFDYQNNQLPSHRRFISKNRPRLGEELLRQIKAAHSEKPINLFFSYFSSAFCAKETINEIRSMGIITVNWFCNASFQFYLVEEIAPAYDYCLVPEKFRLLDYKQKGANPIYCQMAANPDIYKSYNSKKDYEITFIGQAYGDRPSYIKFLLDNGIQVTVWGYGWSSYSSGRKKTDRAVARVVYLGRKIFSFDSWVLLMKNLGRNVLITKEKIRLPEQIIGNSLPDEKMVEMYSRSKINLGFSTCGNTHQGPERIVQVRLRDFEVPMSGGFYITERIDELGEFFEYGKEIEGYSSKEELVDKCRFYLKNDSAREKIRRAGFERAHRDHTWQRRLDSVFQQILGRNEQLKGKRNYSLL